MKFSLQLPASTVRPEGEFQTGEAVAETARALESAGADACWVDDHPAPDAAWLRDKRGHDAIDPFVALSFAGAATTKLRLHTNILVLPYRNPFLTAKAVASLEAMSGGRMILGMGSGYQEGEFSALGVDFSKRGALMDEALETMVLAWSGEEVVKKGRNFDAKGNLPRPTPARPPVLWFGGAADKVLDRVVKYGKGWSPHFGTTADPFRKAQRALNSFEDLRARVAELREKLEAAGRTDSVDVCVNLPKMPAVRDRSGADQILQDLGELADAGATWVFSGLSTTSRSAYLEDAAWFGEEVIARSRRS